MTASIGDRMKLYERASDHHLTPNSPVVIRVDGKAFHSFLRHAERPFDEKFMNAMMGAAAFASHDMHGFKLAYTQSDECTFMITDYDRHETQGWFDYSLNKIVSITASAFTGFFNDLYRSPGKPAIFDSRAFVIPIADAPNAFVWRQRDWERNSVQMLARAHFSHKQCNNKKLPELQAMLLDEGIDWEDCTDQQRHGTFVTRADEFIHSKLTYEEIAKLIEPKEEE